MRYGGLKRRLVRAWVLALLFCSVWTGASWTSALPWGTNGKAVAAEELPMLDVFTAGMERRGGFYDVYWDESQGAVYLTLDRFGEEFLFLTALESGLGSNPVGLDRGQLGDSVVCRWRRVGRRVYLEQKNLKFRAEGAAEAERSAVADSFAPSILWSGEVVASQENRVLVDVTSLVVSDRHGINAALESSNQGSYSLDRERSFPIAEGLKAFPKNVELPAMLTLSSGSAGRQVRAVAADGKAFSIRQRISLIELPEPGYQRRPFDPRIGAFDVAFADYAVPLDQSIFKSLMVRHRLELDPQGKVIEPIVYYVDAAAPEPVRSALVEGASWWSQAFEAAGFPGGFKVEVAPEGMDPLDIRFNFIQWVHRQTRGWSYGSSVIDPRTGEIIKGHVSLGSLRVRQDRLLTENLTTGPSERSGCACGMHFPESLLVMESTITAESELNNADADTGRKQAIDISLARIRQLSAHEVGHTLGIAHNFAASTYADRASVMDYPAPLIRLDEAGNLDFSQAYGVGLGVWDMRTVDYMYRSFPDVDAWKKYVSQKLADDIRDGILYISDADSRPLGGSHPKAHLWDNGADPVAELEMVLKVRRAGLQKFGSDVLLEGEPQGELVRAFTPLYFYHRYQAEAVSKLVGGVDYAYSLPGDANAEATAVEVAVQQRAVEQLMKTLEPAELVIAPEVVRLLVPPSIRTAWSNEEPTGYSGLVFDPLAAAETSAAMTVKAMLHPERAARLMMQGVTLDGHPGFKIVLEPLGNHVVRACEETAGEDVGQDDGAGGPSTKANERAVGRRIAATIVNELIGLMANDGAREDVRAEVRQQLQEIAARLGEVRKQSKLENAELAWIEDKIMRFLDRPDLQVKKTAEPGPPPGSPIGNN